MPIWIFWTATARSGPGGHWERYFEKRSLEQLNEYGEGVLIRINPMELGGNSDAEVTAFRHVLVEFDEDENGCVIPKPLQYAILLASKLPIAVLIDGGGKSLHAWVRVDARDRAEYRSLRRDHICADSMGRHTKQKSVALQPAAGCFPERFGRRAALAGYQHRRAGLATWEQEIKEETPEEAR